MNIAGIVRGPKGDEAPVEIFQLEQVLGPVGLGHHPLHDQCRPDPMVDLRAVFGEELRTGVASEGGEVPLHDGVDGVAPLARVPTRGC